MKVLWSLLFTTLLLADCVTADPLASGSGKGKGKGGSKGSSKGSKGSKGDGCAAVDSKGGKGKAGKGKAGKSGSKGADGKAGKAGSKGEDDMARRLEEESGKGKGKGGSKGGSKGSKGTFAPVPIDRTCACLEEFNKGKGPVVPSKGSKGKGKGKGGKSGKSGKSGSKGASKGASTESPGSKGSGKGKGGSKGSKGSKGDIEEVDPFEDVTCLCRRTIPAVCPIPTMAPTQSPAPTMIDSKGKGSKGSKGGKGKGGKGKGKKKKKKKKGKGGKGKKKTNGKSGSKGVVSETGARDPSESIGIRRLGKGKGGKGKKKKKNGKGKGGSKGSKGDDNGDGPNGGKGFPSPELPPPGGVPGNPCNDDRLYCCIGRGKGGNFCAVEPCELFGELPCCFEEFCPPPGNCCEIKGTSAERMCEFLGPCETVDPPGFFVPCGEGGYDVDPEIAPAETFCPPVYPYCCEYDIPASDDGLFPREVFQQCGQLKCKDIPTEAPGQKIRKCKEEDGFCSRRDLGPNGFCCQFPGFSYSRHCDDAPCENFPGEVPCNITPEREELPIEPYTDDGECDDFGLCNGVKKYCCVTEFDEPLCREDPCVDLGETPCFPETADDLPLTKKEARDIIRARSDAFHKRPGLHGQRRHTHPDIN